MNLTHEQGPADWPLKDEQTTGWHTALHNLVAMVMTTAAEDAVEYAATGRAAKHFHARCKPVIEVFS